MRNLFVAVTALVLSGCGSAVISAAESGDMEAFRAKLSERVAQGDIDVDEAKRIAHAMMSRQIASAQGPLGVENVEAIGRCAVRFDGALAERASAEDEVAAHATLLRQEIGQIAPMAFSHLVDSKEPHWRAVAARSLTLPSDGSDKLVRAAKWRQRLMRDHSQGVRLAAVRAAAEAKDKADVDAVLEVARLDPDPEVRASAIATAGAIGTREAVLGLKDLWSISDHEGKLAIVHAWSAAWRKPFHGGHDKACELPTEHASCEAWHQLQRVSDAGSGMAALLASLELIHDVSPATAKVAEGNAAAVVERLIDKGAPTVRIEAIASAPLGWAHLLEAVVDAADDDETRVAVAALTRMLELEDKRKKATEKLRVIAKERGLAAREAQHALAKFGDKSVLPLVEQRIKAASVGERSAAAAELAALGEANRAALLLGDQDAGVRSNTVCAILDMED